MTTSGQSRPWRSFLAAVGVNVLANLVAAAIIYLGGVLFGIFPREPKAIASALVIVLLAAAWGAILATRFFGLADLQLTTSAGTAFLGGSLVVANLAGVEIDPIWNSPLGLVPAVVLFLGGLWFTRPAWRDRKRRLAEAHRIKGLHWYEP
ncbi:hypothetical protein [Actinoplanes aureus]|uniref:Uncharacterized protein n=1 Tax=Actinoplanes aureus TaxID=2792083 RepID=A0A931FZS8_9ACTN|nr:hypothetical protein [Actinoplanes aureus]MBG0560714.1 hypothetical protein [Actinoplanes aureus]